MGKLEVVDCLVVPLKILVNSSPVEEQIWVWLLQGFLALGICFKSMLKLTSALVVNKEICQMGITEHIPTLGVAEILSNSFSCHLNTGLVILLSLLCVEFIAIWGGLELSVNHRKVSESLCVFLILLETSLKALLGLVDILFLPVNMSKSVP